MVEWRVATFHLQWCKIPSEWMKAGKTACFYMRPDSHGIGFQVGFLKDNRGNAARFGSPD